MNNLKMSSKTKGLKGRSSEESMLTAKVRPIMLKRAKQIPKTFPRNKVLEEIGRVRSNDKTPDLRSRIKLLCPITIAKSEPIKNM